MILETKVDSSKHVKLWVMLMGSSLAPREKAVVELLASDYHKLIKNGYDLEDVHQLVFSTKNMDKLLVELDITRQSLNNYKQKLKSKGVLFLIENNYRLNPKYVPEETLTFKFNYD